MAWYTTHQIRFRGRLVQVETRYGCFNGAAVVKGKPLDLTEGSRDYVRLEKLFRRNKAIAKELQAYRDDEGG